MRRILLGAAVFFMCAFAASAQNFTTVTGTITDTNGLPYSNASVTAEIQPAGTNPAVPPPCAGQTSTNCGISGLQRSTADVNGTFSMTLASNAAIIPGGTQWKFTVTITPGIPPPAGTGSQSCFATVSISGASQSVTASFSACPKLSNTAGGITSVSVTPSGACSPNGSTQILNVVPVQIYKCVAGSWQPDFSTVIDAKAYGVKADAKICIGQFLTINSGSSSVSCFSSLNSSAASVTGNVATIALSGNALTVGAIPWAIGNNITVTNFSGGDTYFNVGPVALTAVSATSVSFALVHANASATTFGTVMNNNVGPFSTAADVTAGPKLLFATSGAGGRDLSQAGVLILAQSTLQSVTNSTTVVASNTATANSLGVTGELVWGSDDTAALTATSVALANANDCGIVLLPMGSMLDSVGQWQIDSPGCVLSNTNGTSIQYGSGAVVKGWGPNVSKVIPLPLFDFTTARNSSLFGSPNFMVYDEWSVYGAGLGTNGNNAVSIVNMNTESVGINFSIVAWLGADINTTGLTFNGRCWACRVQGAGGTGMNVNGGPSQFTNGVVNYSKFAALTVSTTFNSTGSVFGSTATPGRIQAHLFSGTWNSTNDQISGPVGAATNDICLQVDTGAIANLVNMNDSTAPCGAAGTAIGIYNHGGTVRAANSTIAGGTTGNAVLQDLSAKFFDDCGNVLSGSTTLFNNSSGTLFGNCSIAGVALTAGAVVPSANWGTSAAVSAVFGGTTDISFTLTNGSAATGASPTLTYTFPTPFWVRPNYCTITQTGGTQAQIVNEWSVGTPTTTSVVFTYNGTPTINLTEFIAVSCH